MRVESLGPRPGGGPVHPGSDEAVDSMDNRPEIPRAAASVGFSHASYPAGRGPFLELRTEFPARLQTRRDEPAPRPAAGPAPSAQVNIGVPEEEEIPSTVTPGIPKGRLWTFGIRMAEAEISGGWRPGRRIGGWLGPDQESRLNGELEPEGLMAA